MGEDVGVPDILNDIVINCTYKYILQLILPLVPPLNQDGSQVVYPLSTLFSCPSLQVQSAMHGGDGEA